VQLSELQKNSELDFGSGQRHISIHNTYRTTSIPDHVTNLKQYGCMALWRSCNIDILHSIWSHVIPFWEDKKASIRWQDSAPPISGYWPTREPNAG